MIKKIISYDTTLRDGQQGEDVEFSPQDMIRIAKRLDEMGFHFIEGGWPGANPRFDEFFRLAKGIDFKNAKLVAFGKTREKKTRVEENKCLKALVASGTPAVAIFGKTWKLHVEEIMRNSLEENLKMIYESVKFLKDKGKIVIYDAEHFFDGYKDDPEYAIKTLQVALNAGADYLVFCDTNGGTLPFEVEEIVSATIKHLGENHKYGIHAHNDCNMAVANSIIAVRPGVAMVQGTINGYGERTGNVDLTSVIPVLQLKMNYDCLAPENLARLYELSGFVSEVANLSPFKNRPFVGQNAFAHKGGVHVSAINKNPLAYEHMDPTLVGNKSRVLVSDLAGKSNISNKVKKLGIEFPDISYTDIANRVKELEAQGYKFENADDSLRLLIKRESGQFTPLFYLESFDIIISKRGKNDCRSVATVKIISDEGREELAAAEGFGPVGALDNALRKALRQIFPGDFERLHLVDFKVRVIDGNDGTGAMVRTSIESKYNDQNIRTVGASRDVVDASFQALMDSFHSVLKKNGN